MHIMSEEEVMRDYISHYDRSASGYKILTGINRTGHPAAIIKSPDRRWMIMRESPYSGLPGIGGIIEEDVDFEWKTRQSGFRPMPEYAMRKMMAMVDEGSNPIEAARFIDALLAQEPKTFGELERIRPPAVLQGPIVHTYRPIESVIGGQLELGIKLDAELERLERQRGSYLG